MTLDSTTSCGCTVAAEVSIVGFVMGKQEGRSYSDVLKDFFEGKFLGNQKFLSIEERFEKIQEMILDEYTLAQGLRRCVEEIVFSYTYPRLDMEVSKHMNHLLKAPFCIHPKTGHVCVPIDPNHCEEFNPATVPTLSELLGKLNVRGLRADEWDRTSLGKPITYFRSSFLQPLLRSCKEEIESSHSAKLRESKNSLNCLRVEP
ncbi:unnamed protein product [Camellia sinensis]